MKRRLTKRAAIMALAFASNYAVSAAAEDIQICQNYQAADSSVWWVPCGVFESVDPEQFEIGVVTLYENPEGATLLLEVRPYEGCDDVICDAMPTYSNVSRPIHFTASVGTWEAQLPAAPNGAAIGCFCRIT